MNTPMKTLTQWQLLTSSQLMYPMKTTGYRWRPFQHIQECNKYFRNPPASPISHKYRVPTPKVVCTDQHFFKRIESLAPFDNQRMVHWQHSRNSLNTHQRHHCRTVKIGKTITHQKEAILISRSIDSWSRSSHQTIQINAKANNHSLIPFVQEKNVKSCRARDVAHV